MVKDGLTDSFTSLPLKEMPSNNLSVLDGAQMVRFGALKRGMSPGQEAAEECPESLKERTTPPDSTAQLPMSRARPGLLAGSVVSTETGGMRWGWG